MKKVICLFTSFLFCFKAAAHPHIWVYTDLGLEVKESKVIGLNVLWKFDEMYSSTFMMDADLNQDGRLSLSEAKKMQDSIIDQAVTRLSPFIMLKAGTQTIHGYNFEDFKISFNKETEQIEYRFLIKFNEPYNLKGSHRFAIFDPEFYVGFEQSYDFVSPKSCSAELEEDQSVKIYEGLISPEVYFVNCK